MKSKKLSLNLSVQLNNQSGNTVLLALGLAVFFGIAIQAGTTSVFQSKTEAVNSRIVGTRNSLNAQLLRYGSMGATFRSSIDPSVTGGLNAALANCIVGGAALCPSGTKQSVTLYFPTLNDSLGISKKLSGAGPLTPQSTPVRYDTYGNPCGTVKTALCSIEVVSTFVATCPGSAPTCARAYSLAVEFSVRSPMFSGLVAAQNSSMYVTTLNAPPVLVSDILPTVQKMITTNVTVQSSIEADGTTAVPASTLSAVATAAVSQSCVSDPIMKAAIGATIDSAGITDQLVANAVACAGITSVPVALDAAASIKASGTQSQFMAIAITESYVPAAQSAAFVSTLTGAGVVGSGPLDDHVAYAVFTLGLADASLIRGIAGAINGSGISNWNETQEIAREHVTTVAGALAIAQQMAAGEDAIAAAQPAKAASVTTISDTSTTLQITQPAPTLSLSLIGTCSGAKCSKTSY